MFFTFACKTSKVLKTFEVEVNTTKKHSLSGVPSNHNHIKQKIFNISSCREIVKYANLVDI